MARGVLLLLGLVALAALGFWLLQEPDPPPSPGGRVDVSVPGSRSVETPSADVGLLPEAAETAEPARAQVADGGGETVAAAADDEPRFMPGTIVLEVKDAVTGALLGDVWVQEAMSIRRDSEHRHRPERREPALCSSGEPQPLEFRWPETGGSARVRPAMVFAEGYAPRTVDVHIVRDGRYEVPMERACSLRVVVSGSPSKRLYLGIRDAQSGDPEVVHVIDTSEGYAADNLRPGRVLVTAEDINTGGFAAAEAILTPEVPATVTLSPVRGNDDAPLRVVLDFPAGERPEGEIRLEYSVENSQRSESTVKTLELDPATAELSGGRERHVIDVGPVGFGVGKAWVDELFVDAAFLHTEQRPAVVELRVPDPVEFEAVVVDATTGERTPHMHAEVGVGVHDTVLGNRDIDAISPGRFLITARGHQLYLEVPSAHGYLAAYAACSPRPGEVVVIRAEPIPSLLVGLCEVGAGGAPIPWPRGTDPVLTRDESRPEATYRFEYQDDGVRLWVTGESFWTLHLPDIPGYRSGQTQTLWFGEDTELEMVRYGLER